MIVKKKKNYTQSGDPTFSALKSPEKVKQHSPLVGSRDIDKELVNTRSPSIDPKSVRKSLNEKVV